MNPTPLKVAFFDIGGTLGNVRMVQVGGFAEDSAEPEEEWKWFDFFAPPQGFEASSQELKLDVFPDVVEALEELRNNQIRLGIISRIGDFDPSVVNQMLDDAGLLEFFRPHDPEENNLVRYIQGNTPKDKAVFEAALAVTGHSPNTHQCVFIGEDPQEREQAKLAGIDVTSHPECALDILNGRHLSYITLAVPYELRNAEWHQALRDSSLRPQYVTGEEGTTVYGIAPTDTIPNLEGHPLQFEVRTLGEVDDPFTTDMYLLRDIPEPPAGFLGVPEKYAPGFESDESQRWIVDKTTEGVYVALPSGLSIEDYHFEGVRHHGHNLKLIPSRDLLQPVGYGPNTTRNGWLTPASSFMAFDTNAHQLTDDEVKTLTEEITDAILSDYIDRYSHTVTTSRHIQHQGNRLAVRQLVDDFRTILGSDFVTTDSFVHEGRLLKNVIAEMPGQSAEIVVISAHMDSTGANHPGYNARTDDAPGADDDASGTAAVLAAAKALKKLTDTQGQAKRTIRFALFNAEEHGLVGSRVYASKQGASHSPIVAVYQMDMIGYDRVAPSQFEVHFGYAPKREVQERSRALAELITRVTTQVSPSLPLPEIFPATPSDPDPADRRSDHTSFQMAGYAACAVSEDFFRGSGAGPGDVDGNPQYHQPTDTIGELSMAYAASIARVVTAAAWVTANRETPNNFSAKGDTMAKNFDSRNFDFVRAESPAGFEGMTIEGAREVNTFRVSAFDRMTGKPSSLTALPSNLGTSESLLDRSIRQLQAVRSSFGAEEPAAYVPDPLVFETSAGTKVVTLHQQYLGIPIFQASVNVQHAAYEGTVAIEGHDIPPPVGLDVTPQTSLEMAVIAAVENVQRALQEEIQSPTSELFDTSDGAVAQHADPFSLPPDEQGEEGSDANTAGTPYTEAPKLPEINLTGYSPRPLSHATDPAQRSFVGWVKTDAPSSKSLDSGPLGDVIRANLTVFYQGPAYRLGWELLITLPGQVDQYRVIWPADDPEATEPLYRRQTAKSIRATGAVYPFSPRPESTPTPVETPFPLGLDKYPVDRQLAKPPVDPQFPRDWCDADQCIGNGVVGTKGDSSVTFRGRQQGGSVVFQPTEPVGDDQKILNIFYFCNYMHDFFYLLGFDEANGNFQQVNFTGASSPNDPLSARAHPAAVWGTANMFTPPDGRIPIMNMGLVTTTNRHTAFDADVVFHEFCHGVTNRLVGGRIRDDALEQPQSAGAGEAWGDYFALTIQNFDKSIQTERRVTGDWVTRRKAGIRGFPYGPRDANKEPDVSRRFPDSFGNVGQGRYTEEHNIGEIWCAALMHVNRMIGVHLGSYKRGHQIGWQIVVDGLKLTRPNPSFLNARDAILRALEGLRTVGRLSLSDYKKARRGAWEAFAEFGMGLSASCPNASLHGIQEAFDLPSDL